MTRSNSGGPARPVEIGLSDLAHIISDRSLDARVVVGLAGPPCAGKSTVADMLRKLIEAHGQASAAVLPMDGYHLDDTLLEARGLRPRKGAPATFDVGGLAAMLDRLRRNREPEIFVPIFDRDLEIARGAARAIPQGCRAVLVEGNYLLLDRPPWRALRGKFDITVMLDVPIREIRRRMTERWIGYGLTAEERRVKIEGNDIPNAETVITGSGPADYVLSNAKS